MLKSKTSTFFVSGLHCASCQILIEKRLIKEATVNMVDVKLSDRTVSIQHYCGDKITPVYLNKLFSANGYQFSDRPLQPLPAPTNPALAFLFSALFIIGFILLNKSGFASLISVNSTTSLPVFFLFGLLAGFSTCAALTGGIILSLSRQWLSLYQHSDSLRSKLQPHFLFNTGRLISYLVFGALLGRLGNFFRPGPESGAILVVLVSLVMLILGLQMLGIKFISAFQISLPSFITRRFANEAQFKGKYAPVLMGALTFFLPCGFTITAQALALASGNPLQGALIMGFFALGTIPGLLSIGLASVKFQSVRFSQIAGFLVLFFALFNINSQLIILDLPNFNSIFATAKSSSSSSIDSLPPLINGVQLVKMQASASGYTPSILQVRSGVPIRWEITDMGTSGCTNAIIARSLFPDRINLVPGTTSVKEFTIASPGSYRFTCWMGMISGTIIAN